MKAYDTHKSLSNTIKSLLAKGTMVVLGRAAKHLGDISFTMSDLFDKLVLLADMPCVVHSVPLHIFLLSLAYTWLPDSVT